MKSKEHNRILRRQFLQRTAGLGALALASPLGCTSPATAPGAGQAMRMGLVTYLWGRDWDLPTLIRNCELAGYEAVELRTQHAHGVEPSLSAAERAAVKSRFEDSAVVCVGYGSNQEYHSPDPDELKRNIEGTFELIKLSHDIGGSGVKVKPNTLPSDVPEEKTIEQIARSFNEVGKFASEHGQVIRVEVHGRRTAELPVMKAIFDQVEETSVGICWNCNEQDLLPPGLEGNFNLVKDCFGDTVHVRELDGDAYPYPELFKLLVGMDYAGWILLEARGEPPDRVQAMKEQKAVFERLVAEARG